MLRPPGGCGDRSVCLLCSAVFDLCDDGRQDGLEVGHCAVVGDVKDRRGCVVVDADDAFGVLHADLILHGAGDGDVDDHVGLDGGAGLADLSIVRQKSVVDQGAGGGKLTAEEAEQERISKWKRKGLLLNDEDVLQAMEPGDAPKRMCYSVKKDGTISGDLADRRQLKLLEGYVFRILSRLVEEIVSGNVEPNPYTRGSTHDACRFCPYGPVCHPAAVEGRRSYKMMDAQRFWEEIGKEMGDHGG